MKERADGWEGDPSLLPFPDPFLLFHLPNGAFSLYFVGFVFQDVYFYFPCFLGLVCFLVIFGTLGDWRTPALSWEGLRTSELCTVLVQIPHEELQHPCVSQT